MLLSIAVIAVGVNIPVCSVHHCNDWGGLGLLVFTPFGKCFCVTCLFICRRSVLLKATGLLARVTDKDLQIKAPVCHSSPPPSPCHLLSAAPLPPSLLRIHLALPALTSSPSPPQGTAHYHWARAGPFSLSLSLLFPPNASHSPSLMWQRAPVGALIVSTLKGMGVHIYIPQAAVVHCIVLSPGSPSSL